MSDTRSVTLQVSGMIRATSKNVTEAHLGRQPGVISVDANPVSQTATVTYDPETGQFATPDGTVARQADVVTGSARQEWTDLLPTG